MERIILFSMTEHLNVQQMAEKLQGANNVLILCHKNPDGDTIGSACALRLALSAMGKAAAMLCSDAIPARYAYMQPLLYDGSFTPSMVVAVDVASRQLFGEKNDMPSFSKHVDCSIDHHEVNDGYADFTLLDAEAAATAELMIEVIEALEVELTPCMADCLYTALSTDTGCFKFSNTRANTYLTAAKLYDAGARIEELNILLFQTSSRARIEIEHKALSHLEYHLGGRCALVYLTREEIAESGVEPAELEDLTSLPISIADVQVGITLRQQPHGSYRISIRTQKGIDASSIAKRLGGGGHGRAAGCELEGDLDNTKNAILGEVQQALDALVQEQAAQDETPA